MALALFPQFFEEDAYMADVGIYENEGAVLIKAPLPGIKKENIHVTLKDNVLFIEGSSEEEKDLKVHRKRSQRYRYCVGLPQQIDDRGAIEASSEDGILTVSLPKSQAARPHKITVK